MDEQTKKREKFRFLPEARNDRFIITFDASGQAVRTPPEVPLAVEPAPEAEGPAGTYPCPCCGFLTFPVPKEHAVGYICPVCFWENDVFDPGEDDPSDENGGMILREGRENFLTYGAVRPDLAKHAREPKIGETPM